MPKEKILMIAVDSWLPNLRVLDEGARCRADAVPGWRPRYQIVRHLPCEEGKAAQALAMQLKW